MLLLLGSLLLYYFIKPNDDNLLDDLENQIANVENSISDNEAIDENITTEVNADLTDDEKDLEDLEVSLDSILDSLDDIESAEANLGSEVE